MSTKLKLLAQTKDDLAVISASMQDAILQVGDLKFDKQAQTLTLRASRFMHEGEKNKRVTTGMQFNNVLSLSAKNIDRSDPQAFLVLLSISCIGETKNTESEVHLVFSGGGEMRLNVDYIEVRLVDYAKERGTDKLPLHPETNP